MLPRYAVSALYSLGTRAGAPCRVPRNIRKSPPLCSTATARRVAPVGLYSSCSSLPRVWSPLQGYTPWALKRIAPIGAQPCRPRLLAPPWRRILRRLGRKCATLGSVHPRTHGYPDRSTVGGNTTIPLEEQRCLGGTYHALLGAHTAVPREEIPQCPWMEAQYLGGGYEAHVLL